MPGEPSEADGSSAGVPEPTTPDAAVEWGTEMTAVDTDALADPLSRALAERSALIDLCVYAMDRARSAGVVERLTEGLGGVGVRELRPEGEVFDPARHEASGTVLTADTTLEGMIAEVEVPGFADRERMLRPPVVTVYQLRPETPAQR